MTGLAPPRQRTCSDCAPRFSIEPSRIKSSSIGRKEAPVWIRFVSLARLSANFCGDGVDRRYVMPARYVYLFRLSRGRDDQASIRASGTWLALVLHGFTRYRSHCRTETRSLLKPRRLPDVAQELDPSDTPLEPPL